MGPLVFLTANLGKLTDQIWIIDGPLEYHRATSRTIRSYPYPLGIMHIYQVKRKPNKYGKNPPLWESNQRPIGPKSYLTPTPKCH
ncbi:hypothetical protein Hanom_Chr11g01004991 [Helianthus anomalus]